MNPAPNASICSTIAVLVLFFVSGCNVSLQSKQYNFVKSVFAKKPSKPEKTWVVRWQGGAHEVYAINHKGGILFTNEDGIIVTFDGWQVTTVSMLSASGDETLVIKNSSTSDGHISLSYPSTAGLGRDSDTCQRWRRLENFGWRQECRNANGPIEKYTNLIGLNDLGEIIFLNFLVQPGVPPVEIELLDKQGSI